MHERLLPFLQLQYLMEGVVFVEDGGTYVEHYPAYHEVRLSSASKYNTKYPEIIFPFPT